MRIAHYIVPVPKPRMVQSDRWKKRPCVLRYRAFCDQVREAGVEIGDTLDVTFALPMPNSWSQKKRDEHRGQPHRQRPDLDNLVKALADAVLSEDCTVHELRARKIWADVGGLWVGPVEG